MRPPARPRDSGVKFNITPLIDIVFNLIVFFALASLYVRKETAQAVTLPGARQFDVNEQDASRRLTITLGPDRRIFVAGEQVARNDVERLLVERAGNEPQTLDVRLRADRTVPFADVKPMIIACAQHGITNLKVAVEGR
jgi:biopolymer transport protein ExbD